MKKRMFMASWVTAALSVAAMALPALGAESTRTFSSSETRTPMTFGPIEKADKLIGKTVYGSDNQKIGKLDNAIIDLESGRILYAVISTGTIAGKDYAVPASVFTESTGESLHLNIDKAKLEGAPQFTKDIDKPDQWGQASFVDKVYDYFGQTPWWKGNTAANVGSFHNVHKAKDVIGMKIKDVSNNELGKVENVMLDLKAGRVTFVVMSPDSSLNLGNNFFALPPNALTLSSDQKNLVTDLNRDKLASAPQFSKNEWGNLNNQSFASKIYAYYGKQAWFETGSGLQPTGRSGESVYPKK